MKFKKIIILLFLLVSILSFANAAQLKIDDKFPELKSFNLEGSIPDSFEGKVILIDFWASWCGPCRKSFPVLDEIYKKYKEKGFLLIAVSLDESKKEMEKFLKAFPVSFMTVRDTEQKLVEICGIKSMPTSFLLDKNFKIKSIHNGFYEGKTGPQLEKEIEELLK